MLVDVVRRRSGQMRLHIDHRLRLVVGVDARRPLFQVVTDFVFGVTQHLLPACAEEDFAARHIPVPQTPARAFDGELPSEFALTQSSQRPPALNHGTQVPRQIINQGAFFLLEGTLINL